MLVFGGTATLAALSGLLQARVRPRPTQTRAWFRTHRDHRPGVLGALWWHQLGSALTAHHKDPAVAE